MAQRKKRMVLGNCGSCYCAFDGRCKYIWYANDGRQLLFDTHADFCEEHDLSAEHAYFSRAGERKDSVLQWALSHHDDMRYSPSGNVRLSDISAKNSWNNRGRH